MNHKALFCVDGAFSVSGWHYLFLSGDIVEGVVSLNNQISQCLLAPVIVGRSIDEIESASLDVGARKPVLCISVQSEDELTELKALDWHDAYIEITNPNSD